MSVPGAELDMFSYFSIECALVTKLQFLNQLNAGTGHIPLFDPSILLYCDILADEGKLRLFVPRTREANSKPIADAAQELFLFEGSLNPYRLVKVQSSRECVVRRASRVALIAS